MFLPILTFYECVMKSVQDERLRWSLSGEHLFIPSTSTDLVLSVLLFTLQLHPLSSGPSF